ncbi:HD-GYP domain-containing protein [Chitinimonas koreensis]|uniref:HD-GYP domain-containing protein n=1 Tax=Chitinimonas koreensis TaxID=356302 RepID=UPI00040432F1|nr:HD domain-containing phosphohydrolase [Chitinimonas koreensis]QNM96253.1 response regulator [Chitinimonas koreensis]
MKIAIVDDTPINLALMARLLRRIDGVETHLFDSSRAGLDWCLAGDPDLIVVDYMMPGLDGLDFIRQVRERTMLQDIPLVMVTASIETAVRHEALDLGATDFLTKPIDQHEFLARTRNMLALRLNRRLLDDRAALLTEEIRQATAGILARERETLLRLSRAAEFRDPETGAHLQRMARYSALIARGLGWSAADRELLQEAAPMHDIGKIGIPDAILLKPGPLDAAESAVMRSHAELGHRILGGSDSPLLRLGAEIALAHHERFDGSGYPQSLRGTAIPASGRIVAVADVFDALLSRRPYKQPWTLDATTGFLRDQAGVLFDPDCVAALLDAMPEVEEIRRRHADEATSHG